MIINKKDWILVAPIKSARSEKTCFFTPEMGIYRIILWDLWEQRPYPPYPL